MENRYNDKNTSASSGTSSGEEVTSAEVEEAAGGGMSSEALREALEKEKERADRNLANWQRAQADLINYKKRMEQEKEELVRFSNAGIIAGLLPILDDFERAQKSMPSNLAGITWVEGVFLLHRKLLAILEAQGLSQVAAQGQGFNPALHEAVLYGEGDEGKVIAELQKGYKFHDRIIRPAMVQVGKNSGEKAKKEGDAATGDQRKL